MPIYVRAGVDWDSSIYTSHVVGVIGTHHHTEILLVGKGSSLGYPGTEIFSIFASQAARITSMSHHACLFSLNTTEF
jgi:hypothetical protein